ncbi:hypothetical protein, partial [Okeania sp. SIO2F5]
DKPYRIGDKTKYTRITERPKFIIYRGKKRENCDDDHLEVRTGSAPTDGNVILLARVNLDNNGNVSTVDNSVRKLAGTQSSSTGKWSDGDDKSIYYNDGNVGIGTENPSEKLEVDGTVKAKSLTTTGMIRGSSMPPNLIRNSYMNILDGNKPAGYTTLGNVTLEAAHPFTKGFEGPYVGEKPANAADSVDDATEENPYWFGRFNKGARIKRGGLADGWASFRDGKILKITGDNSAQHTVVLFPFECKGNFVTKKYVHFKAWLKISSGKQVGFGQVAGWYGNRGGLFLTKEQSDNAPDGWYRVDGVIPTSEVTRLGGQSFSMGIVGDGDDGSFEVYLALPYLANLDNDSWLPSVSDLLSRDGLTVHPTSGNVGIGTTDPSQKLEVDGIVKATRFVGDGSGLTGIRAGGSTKWSDGENNTIHYNDGNVGIGTNNPSQKLEVAGTVKATKFEGVGDSTIDGSLTIAGNLEVQGDVIARDTEHIEGNVSLGDADNDEVKITGLLRSGHSSGALRIDDALHTTESLTVDGSLSVSNAIATAQLSVTDRVTGSLTVENNLTVGGSLANIEINATGTIQAKYLSLAQSGAQYSNMATFASKNPEPPYVNWYHNKSGGDTVRYGYIQAGDFGQHKEFRFRVENQANFTFLNGNVGIGTTNPSQKLEINGTVKATKLEVNENLRVDVNGDLIFGKDVNNQKFIFHPRVHKNGDFFHFTCDQPDGNWDWNKGILFYRNGNVTIRTSKLEVAGALKLPNGSQTLIYNADESGRPIGDGFRLRYDGNFFGTNLDGLVIEKTDGNSGNPDGGIGFVNTGNDGVEQTALVIRGTGNVGIGTKNPSAKLVVTGGETTLQQESWKTPTLQNGWVNYGRGYNSAGYFKDSLGIVHLKGLVKNGTANTIFTLPVGYRPAAQELHSVATSPNAMARVDILSNGTVQRISGSSTWISLDGITFRAGSSTRGDGIIRDVIVGDTIRDVIVGDTIRDVIQ